MNQPDDPTDPLDAPLSDMLGAIDDSDAGDTFIEVTPARKPRSGSSATPGSGGATATGSGSGSGARPRTRRLRRSGRIAKDGQKLLDESQAMSRNSRTQSSRTMGASQTRSRANVPEPIASDDPMVGSTIEGKYLIIEPLGSGGMAQVYKAWHLMLEKTVALKFIKPEATDSLNFRERFFREARIAGDLIHRNAIQTREFGETIDGLFYMLMDYCPGATLSDVLHAEGPMAPDRAARIVMQVCDVMREAHRLSIVHRDIKSDNVMIGDNDHVWVLDFGLAKIVEDDGEDDGGGLTRAGAVLGTPKYMSPEQALGQRCDHRSDAYSTGMVLYELVTGRLPFEAASSAEMIRRQIVDMPKTPNERVPGLNVPAQLESIIMKAIAKEKANRWQSAQEFMTALEDFLKGEHVEAVLPTEPGAFEHRETLSLGLPEGSSAHRVRHKELDREGISWLFEVDKLRRDILAAFQNQVVLLERVASPSLAPVIESGLYSGDRLYALSEWVDGQTVHERVTQGPMPLEEVVALSRPLIKALAKAHEFVITHSMLSGRLVTITSKGLVLHGVGLVPAGQARSGQPKKDVQDLGMVLFELLAGARREDVGDEAVKNEGLKRVPRELGQVLEKAIDADDPYANASALLRALELVEPRFGRGGASGRSSGGALKVALAAAGILVALGGAGFALSKTDQEPSPIASTGADGVVEPKPPNDSGDGAPTVDPGDAAQTNAQASATAVIHELIREVEVVRQEAQNAEVKEFAGGMIVRADTLAAEATALLEAEQPELSDLFSAKAKLEMAINLYRDGISSARGTLKNDLADLLKQIERARKAAVTAGADRLTKRDLAAVDRLVPDGSAADLAGIQRAREALAKMSELEKLARGRNEIAQLAQSVETEVRATHALRQRALSMGGASSAKAAFDSGEAALAAAQKLSPTDPLTVKLEELEEVRNHLKAQHAAWSAAKANYELAASPKVGPAAEGTPAKAADPSAAILGQNLSLLAELAKQRLGDLDMAIISAEQLDWRWDQEKELVQRNQELRAGFDELEAVRSRSGALQTAAQVQEFAAKYGTLTDEIRTLITSFDEGRNAFANLKLQVQQVLRLANSWRGQADLPGSPEASQPYLRRGHAALDQGHRAQATGQLQQAITFYGQAAREFSQAATINGEVRAIETVLSRLAVAIKRRSLAQVLSYYTKEQQDRAFFESLFSRGTSIQIRFGVPTLQGASGSAAVMDFNYMDRLRDTRVELPGYTVNLQKVGRDWQVVRFTK